MEKAIIAMLVIQVIIIIWQHERIKKIRSFNASKQITAGDLYMPKPRKYTYCVFEYREPSELLLFFDKAQNDGLRLFVLASGTCANKSWIVYESPQKKNNLL